MEKKQFNFKDIKGMLSRDEMKQIKGGSGFSGGNCCNGVGVWYWEGGGASWGDCQAVIAEYCSSGCGVCNV